MKSKHKRPRKPRDLENTYISSFGTIRITPTVLNLKTAKKLHKWLGQAIAYLEWKEKR